LIPTAVPLAAAAMFAFFCWNALKSGILIQKGGFPIYRDESPILFRIGTVFYAAFAIVLAAIAVAGALGFPK
jgi:hypothetical protein